MVLSPRIIFRHMEASASIEAEVLRRCAWLERFHPRILSCRVIIEAPHHHHRRGVHFRVGIDLTVPGAELVVGHDRPEHHSHTDPYVAVRDAFRAARRALMDHQRLVRGQVKEHAAVPTARVARLFDEPGGRFGFLLTDDGREIYFHGNALLDDWRELSIGDRVRFVEAIGDKGPQASTVERIDGDHEQQPSA